MDWRGQAAQGGRTINEAAGQCPKAARQGTAEWRRRMRNLPIGTLTHTNDCLPNLGTPFYGAKAPARFWAFALEYHAG